MSRLENLFLGQERAVTVKGKKLNVRKIPGTDIFIASDGSFVMPRWRGKEEGQTPHQRAQKKWSKEELSYVVYSQGLPAALRGQRLALFRAREVLVPTYQHALGMFQREVRGAIIMSKSVDPKNFSPELWRKLREFGFVVQRAKLVGTKEAGIKILFLYQDIAEGLNVGAMLARVVAITDRLRDRLLGLYAWVRKYSAQEKVLKAIETEINQIISEVTSRLRMLGRGEQITIIQGTGNRRVQKLIVDQLTTLSMKLEPLRLVQPFSRWMDFVTEDFDDLLAALQQQDDEGKNYILARALIERILFSIQLKKIQHEIDLLLLRVGQDAIIKQPAWNNYATWAISLAVQFQSLASQEKRVGLREKVCCRAGRALYEASELAGADKPSLSLFKAAVKRAYAIL